MTNPTTDRLAGALHQMATFQDGNAQPHTIALIVELADIARSQQAEIERLREVIEALAKVMPANVNDGPDYAEVFFADGKTHSTHAMTMNPQDWRDLQSAWEQAQ